MMSRSQVVFDPEMQRRARERAQELGISLAEYIRHLVTRDLGELRRSADPSAVFDLGRSTGSDLAREKDDMLGEAVSRLSSSSR